MNFLKNVLAAILGFFIATGILFVVFLFVISALASTFGDDEKIIVKENSVLVLDFKEPIKDYSKEVYFEDFDYKDKDFNGLSSILKAIEIAKTDDKIKGIHIKSSGNIGGLAMASELRQALADFKSSGKFIYAHNDFITQTDYYLQSVADSVFLSPMGELSFRGLSSEILFFKEMQEKSGVNMEVIRHGKYKSAVEPFLENTMSEANRLQMTELLNSLWNVMATDIAQNRNISIENLNNIAHNLEARTAELALKNKLIDGIIYSDEFEQILCRAINTQNISDLDFITINKYAESVVNKARLNRPKDKIAVIYAEGEIIYGKGNPEVIGNETIVESLRAASEDESIKAIVLRINSPGGSALASELIHREIELAKKRKKVYVSMGNYAASGGYYIACNADKIFAQSGTVTGSIGVFGVLPNVHRLANDWGINAEQVQTHNHSLEYSIFEKPTETFIKTTTESVEMVYNTFLERVANGRNMTKEQVNEIAQGRVWSGIQAQQNGLVDAIGNLQDALQFAASDNNIESFEVKNYPLFKMNFEEILTRFGVRVKTKTLKEELGDEAFERYQQIKSISQQKGIQARLPYNISMN
ncbi:signal peptide peptidase SppA [Capnocytophaga canimorsus]|uniref:signal peptide peptidase SppA n=1 Tax=Capnocytophaga canimorsus TaxID=28188 RepID=UPI0037D13FD7